MIRIEVPPNGKFWLAPTRTRATSGMSETMREVDGARHGDSGQDVVEVLGRGSPGPDTRDEAAVLLHVVGDLGRVERDRHVEEREEEDQGDVHRHVERVVTLDEVLLDPLDPAGVVAVGARVELRDEARQGEQRAGEDDGDDAGHVDLERDVGATCRRTSGGRPSAWRTAPGCGAGTARRRRPRR